MRSRFVPICGSGNSHVERACLIRLEIGHKGRNHNYEQMAQVVWRRTPRRPQPSIHDRCKGARAKGKDCVGV